MAPLEPESQLVVRCKGSVCFSPPNHLSSLKVTWLSKLGSSGLRKPQVLLSACVLGEIWTPSSRWYLKSLLLPVSLLVMTVLGSLVPSPHLCELAAIKALVGIHIQGSGGSLSRGFFLYEMSSPHYHTILQLQTLSTASVVPAPDFCSMWMSAFPQGRGWARTSHSILFTSSQDHICCTSP